MVKSADAALVRWWSFSNAVVASWSAADSDEDDAASM